MVIRDWAGKLIKLKIFFIQNTFVGNAHNTTYRRRFSVPRLQKCRTSSYISSSSYSRLSLHKSQNDGRYIGNKFTSSSIDFLTFYFFSLSLSIIFVSLQAVTQIARKLEQTCQSKTSVHMECVVVRYNFRKIC